jgi:hypothetical protein
MSSRATTCRAAPRARGAVANPIEPVGFSVWQRLDEIRIDGRGGDGRQRQADGERGDRDDRKAGRSAEGANGEPQVLFEAGECVASDHGIRGGRTVSRLRSCVGHDARRGERPARGRSRPSSSDSITTRRRRLITSITLFEIRFGLALLSPGRRRPALVPARVSTIHPHHHVAVSAFLTDLHHPAIVVTSGGMLWRSTTTADGTKPRGPRPSD